MTSTNDEKDVKSNQTSGPKGKTYFIELYKSLEARLSEGGDASERTKHLCEAWRRVHSLCQHSAPSTHSHLLSWLQRHTARAVLQTEWQTSEREDDRKSLEESIDSFIAECEAARASRDDSGTPWEVQLVARGEWFKRVLEHPWAHPVLTLLLNPNGTPPTDEEVLEWLKEERGVTFVVRLYTLVGEKCDDIAMSLATAVMERVRAAMPPVSDAEEPMDKSPPENAELTFGDKLKEEAGFTTEVWETLTDIEFVLLHKRDSKQCIALAKQTPLPGAYHLIERLQKRLEISPCEKRLWKNSKEVAILIAQVVIARCMMVGLCGGAARAALYCCARLLARLLAPARLPSAADALANQAPTARHLHTLAAAVDKQLSSTNEEMKPYVCELYVRAITAGMNELERLKLKTEKETEARTMEKTLASWFVQLGDVLARSDRVLCECTLTAFSLHPSLNMYQLLDAAPQPAPQAKDSDESNEETTKSEFGSWANDSRSQTNFVKTSETLNLKHTQNQANVLSTAIFNEGEALGLSPELCQDIAVLLSGPRVKTLSWDMDRSLLLENCRAYMERTHGGTRVLTRELKYLNIDPDQYKHLPEERDDDENDPHYGIERGYEHLVPEEIWEDANDPDRTETAWSSTDDDYVTQRRKKNIKKVPLSSDEDSDPLSFMAEAKKVKKKKGRPLSKERSKERAKKKQELVDPLHIGGDNQYQKKDKRKEKKERKKKEKTPRVKPGKLLANLVGLKVVQNKKNPETVTTIVNSPVTDSDYDSQGKNSLTSLNSEGNEHDVLCDGLLSMDEFRSLQQKNSHSLNKMEIMKKEFGIARSTVEIKRPPPHFLVRPPHNPARMLYRPTTPSPVHRQSPSTHARNSSPNLNTVPDDVRTSISKLLDFRRTAALELNNKQYPTAQSPQRKPAIMRPNIPIQTNVSPKAVAIPDIPKSYINKQHAESFADLRRQMDNVHLPLKSNLKQLHAIPSPATQFSMKTGHKTIANKPRSRIQQPNKNVHKMPDPGNVSYDRLMAEIAERQDLQRSNYDIVSPHTRQLPTQSSVSIQRTLNTVSAGQRDYQNFLNEYEQKKIGTIGHALDMSKKAPKDVRKDCPLDSRVVHMGQSMITKGGPKTLKSAKQTQQKKPENSLNTFSRLSYMHKNKQVEMKNKTSPQQPTFSSITYHEVSSELDAIIKEHQREQMRVIQAKNERFDKLLEKSPNYNTQVSIKKHSPEAQSRDHPLLSNLLQNTSTVTNETQQIPVQISVPDTSLSEKDQKDLLHLLRQQSKLNAPIHHTTNLNSKPSTSSSNNDVSNNSSLTTNYNSTSSQKAPSNPDKSVLETKIINIISNTFLKQRQDEDDCVSDMSKSPILATKSNKPDSLDKDKNNAPIKGHVKKDPVKYVPEPEKPEWQSVMSEILKHKTPCRGHNALDVALNKSSFDLAFEKSLQKPVTIFPSKQTSSKNNTDIVKQHGNTYPPKLDTTLAHNVTLFSNKGLQIEAASLKQPISSSDQNEQLILKKIDNTMNEKMKQNPVAKKLPQEVQRKQFIYAAPKHDDPFISGIPNSDYDLLEELMDDDLRKEIGELSSDEESYNAAAQSFLKLSKGNEKRVSVEYNRPLSNMAASKSMVVVQNLNAHQPPMGMMQSASQKPDNKIVHGSNTAKVPQSAVGNNTQDNAFVVTSTNQSVPAHVITTPKRENPTYNNVKIFTNNQVTYEPNIYISALPQQVPLQNVVLIGSQLVYEGYSTIQTPMHGVGNIAPYVAVNNTPNMSLYQTTQFGPPVANPLIIDSSMTMPVMSDVPCAAISAQPNVDHQSNSVQSIHPKVTVEPQTQPDLYMGIKTSDSNAEINSRVLETDYPLQDNGQLDVNKTCERKVLSEVQELGSLVTVDRSKSENIEYDVEINKDAFADQERLKNKRLAILNRETSYRCDDEPIPLIYAPLPQKAKIESKQHNITEVLPLSFTLFHPKDDKNETPDNEQSIKIQDIPDATNKIERPDIPDSNESKENKNQTTVPCRRILLRSSNKIKPMSNAETVVSETTTSKKSKVKLKPDIQKAVKKVGASSQNNADGKEVSTQKRASKRLRNKTITKEVEQIRLKTPTSLKPSTRDKVPPKNKASKGRTEKPTLINVINDNTNEFDVEEELSSKNQPLLVSKISTKVPENKEEEEKYSIISKDILAAVEAKNVSPEDSLTEKIEKASEQLTTNLVTADVTDSSENIISNDKILTTNVLEDGIDNDINDVTETITDKPAYEEFIENFSSSDSEDSKMDKNINEIIGEITEKSVFGKLHTEESKRLTDGEDYNSVQVSENTSKLLSSEDTIVQLKAQVDTSEITANIATAVSDQNALDVVANITTAVNDQNTNDLSEKDDIDLDMTVTCEELKVSKMASAISFISARNKYINPINTTDVIGSDVIKHNETQAPISSDVQMSEITGNVVNDSDIESVQVSRDTLNDDQEIISNQLRETHSDSLPITNTTASTDEGFVVVDNDHKVDVETVQTSNMNINVLNKFSEMHSDSSAITKNLDDDIIVINDVQEVGVQPVEASRYILNKDQQIMSNQLCEKQSDSLTTHNTTANMNDDVVLIDDDSNLTPEIPDPNHDNAATQKETNKYDTENTDMNELSDIPQTFKDSILIEHLPSDESSKKSVRVTLPGGRKFKATVYGEVHVTFDTLFTYPSIKSALLNRLTSKKLYTMNIKQITTVAKNDPKVILSAQIQDINPPVEQPVETIDLLSDDEDNWPSQINKSKSQTFVTEYGKYTISTIDQHIFTKHQNKFSQKAQILLKKCDSKLNINAETSKNGRIVQSDILPLVPRKYVTGLLNDIGNNLNSEAKNTSPKNLDIIEIDDSSNDSLHHGKSNDNIQPIEKINELKNVLLKELGVVCKTRTQNDTKKKGNKRNKSRVIKYTHSTNNNCQLSEMPKSSAVSTNKVFPIHNLDKEEQLKIINKKCYIKIVRCDDLVKLFEKEDLDLMKTSAKALDDEPFTIAEDFSILDNLDANVVDIETRSSSPVIELPEILVSLDDTTVTRDVPTSSDNTHNTKSAIPVISLSCEANWFSTKPMEHLQSHESSAVLVQLDISGRNDQNTKCEISSPCVCEASWFTSKPELHLRCVDNAIVQFNISIEDVAQTNSKITSSCTINEISSETVLYKHKCVPSLLSLVLKTILDTNVIDQLGRLRDVVTRSTVNSLKRKSTSFGASAASKVPKLNDKIIEPKLIDCSLASTVTLDSFDTDVSNDSASILESIKLASDLEKSDQSVDATKSLIESDNEYTDEVARAACDDNHNFNIRKRDEQIFEVDSCESQNNRSVKVIDNSQATDSVDYEMDAENIVTEIEIKYFDSMKDNHTKSQTLETKMCEDTDKTDQNTARESRSPSPIIELAQMPKMWDTTCESQNKIIANEIDSSVDNKIETENIATEDDIKEIDNIEDKQVDKHTKRESRSPSPVIEFAHILPMNDTNCDDDASKASPIIEVAMISPACDNDYRTSLPTENVGKVFQNSLLMDTDPNNDKEVNLEKENGKDKLERRDIDCTDDQCTISYLKETINTSLEIVVTNISKTHDVMTQSQTTEDLKQNVTNDCNDIETSLAKIVGESLIDINEQNQPENYLINASDEINQTETLKIEKRDKQPIVDSLEKEDISVKCDASHVKNYYNDILLLEESPSVIDTRITDHEYANSFNDTSVSGRMSDSSHEQHNEIYVTTHDGVFLSDRELVKELEEEIIEMRSDEIIDDILFEIVPNKTDKDEIETSYLAKNEKVSTTTDSDCLSQWEEYALDVDTKDINKEGFINDSVESCDVSDKDVENEEKATITSTHLRAESEIIINDDCCSPMVDSYDHKSDIFVVNILDKDKKEPNYSFEKCEVSIENISNEHRATFASTNVAPAAEKAIDEYCSNNVEDQNKSDNLDVDLLEKANKKELAKDSVEKSDMISSDVSAKTIVSKYQTLIENDSDVLKGMLEYEHPECGLCYVVPAIETSPKIELSKENTEEVVPRAVQDVNKIDNMKDDMTNINISPTSQPTPIKVNNHYDSKYYDDIEIRLAKIVGEPIMDVDTKETQYKGLEKQNMEEKSTDYQVIFDLENNDRDHLYHKTSDVEFLLDGDKKECCSSGNNEAGDEALKVMLPKQTYSRGIEHIRRRWKNLKRKVDMSDTKLQEKKYRKGKHIDYHKFTAAAIAETAYAKDYKRLLDYCSSVRFSYSVPFHKVDIDVHSTLQSWPIVNCNREIESEDLTETSATLFTEIEKSEAPKDPLEQTLSDEIMSKYNENCYKPSNIEETNFNMGFGEMSGRVIQKFKDGEYTTFSAATLSDVKQLQPLLPSDEQEALLKRQNEKQDEQLKMMRFVDRLNVRDKVRSFFKKTEAELALNWELSNKKDDWEQTNAFSNCLFDLTSLRNIRPPPVDITVNVVQVGQLPVSAAAQNPVTCDPRVTHVSNVSPSQCSPENSSGDDIQTNIKTEYTELTTANITLPLMQEYVHHHQSIPTELQQPTNLYGAEDTMSMATEIKTVVKIELMEETSQEQLEENVFYENNSMHMLPNENVNNGVQYQIDNIAHNITVEADCNVQPMTNSLEEPDISESVAEDVQYNDVLNNSDHNLQAMNIASVSVAQRMIKTNPADAIAETISQNAQTNVITSQGNTNNFSKSTPINAIALHQALAHIQNQPSENNQQTSTNPQVLHIVQGNNSQSVINKTNGTQLLHIVKNKSCTNTTKGTPATQPNSFSGLSVVDGSIQQNGNQFLHIVNTANQKNSNPGQVLKRVNLLTNVQGSNEQKMVQFVCKSADGKTLQLPQQQRGMVLRLHPLEPSNVSNTPKQNEAQDPTPSPAAVNDSRSVNGKQPTPQEMKSRSLYEENYAKFVQNGDPKPVPEKSTSLPKFNQVFGKQGYQDQQNEMDDENLTETAECPPEDNIQLQQINDINNLPILTRKPQTQPPQAQPNLVQQIKQTVNPMNIQTMHGGVIYTRQIPVNIGGGQTINLITVPSTELTDESAQKQQTDAKFGNQEGDPPIVKIVPTNPAPNLNGSIEDNNAQMRPSTEANPQPTPQPQQVLTQMRIKLPMLSKTPQMVGGTRVVRPSFFQIQRNVIGGANQQVYQQLVLTAAPSLGQSIRVPAPAPKPKTPPETQSSPESQMSSSTLEQLREFDMVLEQVKERSTVQPGSSTSNNFTKLNTSADTTDSSPSTSTQESPTPVLYSVGNTQPLNMVNYVNRKSTITSTSTSSYERSPDSTATIESPSSSTHAHIPQTVTSEPCASSSSCASEAAATTIQPKPKKKKPKPSTSNLNPFNIKNTPKPSSQKPLEDEQTTQRILYILAEYKEQVENSPDKDKPAPRRRNNPAAPNAPGSSKRKKSSSGSRRRDMSPVQGEDSCRTMGSEDSSCGTSMGECNECLETHSPEESPKKVVRRLTFEQETHITETRTIPQRNVIVTDGQAFTVRGAPGKPAATVLMPANYLLPVSMVKGGQQIAIVTNRGPKLLVGAGENGAGGTLLFQRLLNPAALKPMLARPGVRHIRLPTAALHNLQAFNIATPATSTQPPDSTASPAPAPAPPDLVDTRAMSSPWPDRDAGGKPDRGNSSPEGSEPWNLPSSSIADDYGYEEIVRTDNIDRTVLDAIPDRYSPDLEAQRIFDKMFDVDSKKSMYDSRCGYDIDASDDDKAYHQVVQRKDGRHTRVTHVSAAALRHKCAILEQELRLQKSLSEECEDLGVDSPSASDLFPEAELLFAPSPAHEQTIDSCTTPQPSLLQGIPQPDLEDQIATDHFLTNDRHDELDINLDDVGEIVTVGEDGMTTIPLDHEEFARSHEEFARSHPNTTFHSEPEDGEIPPFAIAQGIKGRQITFHTRGVPGTVVMAPQTTVISQATIEATGTQNTVKFTDIDNMLNAMPSPQHPVSINIPVKENNEGLSKFDRLLNESRELHVSNTASAIVHSTGNGTQVIRRVHYETRRDRYTVDNPDSVMVSERRSMQSVDTSPERHPELFWDTTPARPERRRFDFSSDSDKCSKSSYDETSDSAVRTHTRLDSVIKAARTERKRSDVSDDYHPPLRTYPPKRPHHHLPQHHSETDRSVPKTRVSERCYEGKDESRRRASNRGVVKRGCQCCNGSTPPKPKKSRSKKSNDFPTHN